MATFKKIGSIKFDEGKIRRLASSLPILLANNTENHFKQGFTKGGYKTNKSKTGWKERQFTKGSGSRNVLIKTGTLQRDIQKRIVNFNRIVIGTSSLTNKYSETHNEGAKIRVTTKMRKFFWAKYNDTKDKSEKEYWKNLALTKKSHIEIPQREYIGDSKELERDNEKIIDKELLKLF